MMSSKTLKGYNRLLDRLKKEIQAARIKASLTINVQLLIIYWKLGKAILDQQKQEGWGTKVINRLSEDLRVAFPDMKGISLRNFKYMKMFAEAYPQFVQEPLAQLQENEKQSLRPDYSSIEKPLSSASVKAPIVQAPLAQLTWYHHITLLTKVKDPSERLFYIQKTIENNWSRNVLVHQIESKLFERQGKAVTNFDQTLSAPQNDLAKELIKDPYKFDFLNLYEEYKEKDLENALTDNLTRFLLELGAGFSFVSRQYSITAGNKDYSIDLLFYHFKLHCFVAVELKTGEFLPEYVGKLNFYLNLLDDKLKRQEDNPSIGILICKQHDKIIAEYALRGINTPIGISEYKLPEALPDNLKDVLPTIEQIEAELKNTELPDV